MHRLAMRICMERIIPARRGARITMNLPTIRTSADIGEAAEKVTQAIRRGEITPTEGGAMMSLLESRSRIIERIQIENEKAEAHIGANTKEYMNPQLAALTDDELAQLLAITAKMEASGSDAVRADKPPAVE
jgi:hypothetical protein